MTATRAAGHATGLAVLLLLAASAWAGPPLVCHPWVPPGAPPVPRPGVDVDGKPLADCERALLRALDEEKETLVRLQMTQTVLIALDDDPDVLARLLGALEARAEDAREKKDRAARRLDFVVARETAKFVGRAADGDVSAKDVAAAAREIEGDAAAWFAVARAGTPLMRSATPAEHARAFLKAVDLTKSLPEGEKKERLSQAIAWDLEHLEAYLLDREIEESGEKPTPESRLEALRRHAAAK